MPVIHPHSFYGDNTNDESSPSEDDSDSLSSSDISVELTEDEYSPSESASEDSEYESSNNDNINVHDSDRDEDDDVNNIMSVSGWTDVSGTTLKSFPYTGKPAVTFLGEPTPMGCYNAIVDQEVVDLIVIETNRFGEQTLGHQKWKTTTDDEITKFLGIICYMGLVKYPKISDYWSKKKIYKNAVVPKIMARNRFQQLLRFIHFADNETADQQDRLYKLRPLVEKLCEKFSCLRIPDEMVAIDETMIKFRGRLFFKQYIPGKSSKYGIKLFKICDPDGYTYKVMVYTGKENGASKNTVRASDNTVLILIDQYLDEGRTLVLDNYYTNASIAAKLLEKKTHLVGTLRKNSKDIPKTVLKPTPPLKKGDIVCQERNGIVVGCWKDKREVRFLTTKHKGEIVSTGRKNRQGEMIKKPDAIVHYNECKQGVDISDQMSSYFSPLRKSKFWYNKVAFELLLGTSVVNALLVYNKLSQKKVQISDFRESLVISMLKLDHNDQQLQASTSRCKHKLEMSQEKLGNNRKKRKRCSGCYAKYSQTMTSKEAKVKSKQISTYCSGCDDKPYLCLECYDAHIKNQQ